MPVDAFLHGVDVNEREHVPAWQQRGAAGQVRQQQPAHLLQLEHVTPGECAQERAQRGRGADPAEQGWHRTMPQQVHVIDAVRPGDHPSSQARDLQVRVHPAPVTDPDMLRHQAAQARPLRERYHRDQPGPRHEIRVIKRRTRLRQPMQQSHLRGVLSSSTTVASVTPIVPAQRAPFASTRPSEPLFTRWIEAKNHTKLTGHMHTPATRSRGQLRDPHRAINARSAAEECVWPELHGEAVTAAFKFSDCAVPSAETHMVRVASESGEQLCVA